MREPTTGGAETYPDDHVNAGFTSDLTVVVDRMDLLIGRRDLLRRSARDEQNRPRHIQPLYEPPRLSQRRARAFFRSRDDVQLGDHITTLETRP